MRSMFNIEKAYQAATRALPEYLCHEMWLLEHGRSCRAYALEDMPPDVRGTFLAYAKVTLAEPDGWSNFAALCQEAVRAGKIGQVLGLYHREQIEKAWERICTDPSRIPDPGESVLDEAIEVCERSHSNGPMAELYMHADTQYRQSGYWGTDVVMEARHEA